VIWGSGKLGERGRDLAGRDRAAAVQIARLVLWLGGAALILPLVACSAWLRRVAAQVHASSPGR
jgi:hypothetical protein